MRIALTGNPNSGKTTMYNALTGRNERVGNWAGVTVEKKEHPIKKAYYGGEEQLIAVDLPGAYSMSPFTSEESITSSYVKKEHPDVIINIVDATNLSRSLFFTTQLLELGIPVVVALNKSDINEKKETKIDVEALSAKLGCPVIQTVSTSNEGLKAVVEAAAAQAGRVQEAPYREGDIDLTDKKVVEAADRKRFDFVNGIVAQVEKRKVFTKDKNSGDSIDAVLTKPWLGIPIFAVVMFLVFQISQVWVGPYIADALVAQIENFQGWVGELVADANPLLSALLVDGIIGGVGAVVGFLPLVMVMYFLIALLEDCGYMSRVAVVLDPIFKKVGLSGKSVIPFVIGIGCGIPGVMACRTIRNERERRATAMLTTFMPCQDPRHYPDRRRVLRQRRLGQLPDVCHRHRPDLPGRSAGECGHRLQGAQVLLHHRAARVQAPLPVVRLQVHVQPGLGLYREGRHHHPAVQHRGADHADLRLELPGG